MTDMHEKGDADWLVELESIFQQVRGDSLLYIFPILVLCGVFFGGIPYRDDPLQGVLTGLWFGLLALLVGFLRFRNVEIAVWTLITGSFIGILLVAIWLESITALTLLALPTGLAALLLGKHAGLGISVFVSLVTITLPSPLVPTDLRLVILVSIWCTFVLIRLATRPLRFTGELAWSGYRRSNELLEQSRDYQLKLQQTLEDLTFANQQLERLNRLANSLRQAEEETRRAKEQFVANVSHELRTPLNMIIGFIEMIVNAPETYNTPLPPALLADLTVVLRNSQHLSNLVDDVLDLSQIEAGKMALTKERIRIQEITEEAVTAVRPLYESKGLYLHLELDTEIPPILADPTRIREVLLNLLSNAGRFTEQGGVTLKLVKRSAEILVSVSDTGPGIKKSDIDRIFQPFQQLDSSIRKKTDGTGLGLTISREFVQMHGGRMWFESAPGQGSTFYFSLPIYIQEQIPPGALQWINPEWPFHERTRKSLAPVPPILPRLLVCESGSALHRLLVRYLSEMDVVKVSDLSTAAQDLIHNPAQALVINAGSLEEAAERLSHCPELPHATPVIACSVPSTPQVASILGISDYLIKPISRHVLLESLNKLDISGRTILVVDDEPDSLRLFRRILSAKENGYRVLTARDGQEALAIMRDQQPDCILMDLIMPEMDGFQLLAVKQADPTLAHIPVIVISAQDVSRQPILSKGLTITRGQGLTLQQLLLSIKALSAILSSNPLAANGNEHSPSRPVSEAVPPA